MKVPPSMSFPLILVAPFVLAALALLPVGPALAADNTITGISLKPAASVSKGTDVTITVDGTGACGLHIETNGAYMSGGVTYINFVPGLFPRTLSFIANKEGQFAITVKYWGKYLYCPERSPRH